MVVMRVRFLKLNRILFGTIFLGLLEILEVCREGLLIV